MHNDIAARDLGTPASLAYGIGPPRKATCMVCQTQGRTNKKWTPYCKQEVTLGWVCPECPAHNEPIRRFITNKGVRFCAVIDVSTPGTSKRKQKTAAFDSLSDARVRRENPTSWRQGPTCHPQRPLCDKS